MHADFQGTAQAFTSSLKNEPWLLWAALITVYLVLGVLYESFIHPLTILSTLPSAGIGAFVAATFAGLFAGTFFLGFLADRFGRRSIFTFALLGYTAASVIMACQTTSGGVLLWRFIAGIGVGVEVITIDAYITELVPRDRKSTRLKSSHRSLSRMPSSA